MIFGDDASPAGSYVSTRDLDLDTELEGSILLEETFDGTTLARLVTCVACYFMANFLVFTNVLLFVNFKICSSHHNITQP